MILGGFPIQYLAFGIAKTPPFLYKSLTQEG